LSAVIPYAHVERFPAVSADQVSHDHIPGECIDRTLFIGNSHAPYRRGTRIRIYKGFKKAHFLSRMSRGFDWKKSLQPLHEPGTFDTGYFIYSRYLGVIEKGLCDACGCKICSQCLKGALIAKGGGPELSAG